MKNFKDYFIYETERFFCKPISIIIILLLCCSLIFIQLGVQKYNNTITRKDKFQEIEKEKVGQYTTMTQYGTYGYRVLFLPAPISIFFINSGVVPDVTAYVDSGERLKIFYPVKGKNIFEMVANGMADFSGILLFFGSLMALLYGYDAFKQGDYLRFLASMTSAKCVFFWTVISRIFLLFLMILGTTACALVLMMLNGFIFLLDSYFFLFISIICAVSLFFFSLGTLFSTVKSRVTGISTIISCWFILLFVIPTGLKLYIAEKADIITPIYELERKKLKIVMDFEKRSIEEAGTFDYGKKVEKKHKDVILGYWNNEFREIHALEKNMQKQMKEIIALHHKLSAFFVTTFYQSTNSEISSRGYYSLVLFINNVQVGKMKFFRFYMDNLYFKENQSSKIKSFVKGNENLFFAESSLPAYLIVGYSSIILYIAGLFFWSYFRFKKRLDFVPAEEIKGESWTDVKLKQGQFKVWCTEGNFFLRQLYTLFSGAKGIFKKEKNRLKVSIDEKEILPGSKKLDFLYICHPSEIPGNVKVKSLVSLIAGFLKIPGKEADALTDRFIGKNTARKKFKKLSKDEQGQFILAVMGMKKFPIYLINDAARSMTPGFAVRFKKRMEALSASGALVLFLTPDIFFLSRTTQPGKYFYETDTWCNVVDSLDLKD